MIPKTIHYCWFGGNQKPELVENCIASWHRFCPDWEIIEWNESNYDVDKAEYTKEAYGCKKWAFVADYARFDVVNQFGGVYLDTDVELLDTIDGLCDNTAFYAFESGRNIASGLGFGAEKEHETVKACLNYYTNKHFITDGKMDLTPCPRANTESLCLLYPEFRRDGSTQVINNVLFLSMNEYGLLMKHLGTQSWVDYRENKSRVFKESRIKSMMRNPKTFETIDRLFGEKVTNGYEFIVYDLIEYGALYYIRRAFVRGLKRRKR